jgi:vacuolar protein sorting-associated protein 13A/C
MAKRLLLNILVDILGTYVEGLSIENLKVGVLSGKIELHNLQLKRTGLDNLNLPISVTHGSLKSLILKIPWTALESKPVRVVIDGVYLQAGPLDVSTLSPDQLRKMAYDATRLR